MSPDKYGQGRSGFDEHILELVNDFFVVGVGVGHTEPEAAVKLVGIGQALRIHIESHSANAKLVECAKSSKSKCYAQTTMSPWSAHAEVVDSADTLEDFA